MFEKILENVKTKSPLVHNITNYVTVNDCANILLACGSSPIMSDDIMEVSEITSICNALVINIGTLNTRTIESMLKAGKKANELNHPVILDPVGAGASALRTDTALNLLEKIKFSVIRGNISEIKTISKGCGSTKGVDADVSDTVTEAALDEVVSFAKNLSKKTGAVIAITGAIDIVANSEKAYIIKNGHPMMSKITGSGCMLTSLIGGFCGANPKNILDATAAAVCSMGLCGEMAYEKVEETNGGTSSFRMHLIDSMSKLTSECLNGGAKIESR
ncbi:MAG: hydroxyethylthiazole kinase [Clostridia bacterium]